MKTVTHEGKVYKLDETYVTQANEIMILIGIEQDGDFIVSYPFESNKHGAVALRTSKYTTGTIEEAPPELENGEWYMCVSSLNSTNHKTCLLYIDGKFVDPDCSGIDIGEHYKPLYKMVKA